MFKILSFIISSIIGSGIFIIPYTINQYGFNGIIGFILSAIIFIFIGYLFGNIKETPIEFIQKKLGYKISFFVGWTYWLISWISTIVVVNECLIYLIALFPNLIYIKLWISIGLISLFIGLNYFGLQNNSIIDFSLTILKIIPMLCIPFLCLKHANGNQIIYSFDFIAIIKSMSQSIWCFIGIECGAIICSSYNIKNKNKLILTGIIVVALLYIFNIFSIFYYIGFNINNPAIYSQIFKNIFGNDKLLSIIISIICIGTLNSWFIASGITAYDNSKINIFPIIFQKKNKYQSPFVAILYSSIGLIPLSFLISKQSIAKSLIYFINISSNLFLLFYALFLISYYFEKKNIFSLFCGVLCCFIFIISGNFFVSLIFICSGIPLYLYMKKLNNIQ